MGALLGPTHRTGFVKWGLVTHTGAMFSFLTIMMTLFLHVQSISYIDNREFPGAPSAPWVGTVAYQLFIYNKAINVIPFVIFLLNNWLADGLLVRPVFNSISRVFKWALPLALSLLYHLFHELLDHRLPMPDVPHLYGCVFESPVNRQLRYSLTSLV